MARIRPATLLLLPAMSSLFAGCGGGGAATTTAAPTTTSVPATTTAPAATTVVTTTTSATEPTTTSPPGPTLVWTRADVEGALAGPGLQLVFDVSAGGPGLVAVGAEDLDGDTNAAVWLSSDGYAWEQVPRDEAVFGGPGVQWMSE